MFFDEIFFICIFENIIYKLRFFFSKSTCLTFEIFTLFKTDYTQATRNFFQNPLDWQFYLPQAIGQWDILNHILIYW